ncbi:hypothetical protein FKM82_028649 [Ascaphus truei]
MSRLEISEAGSRLFLPEHLLAVSNLPRLSWRLESEDRIGCWVSYSVSDPFMEYYNQSEPGNFTTSQSEGCQSSKSGQADLLNVTRVCVSLPP